MSFRILIVEDHFIEANDLRIVLERAGHIVCGIANSVTKAFTMLEDENPEIVLVDIFLKGTLTGIDLAKRLSKENIPFIYLSANSNQSTLEEAKATQPYGFLVKPFREPDILVALDIAIYRHQHNKELMERNSLWLGNLLSDILSKDESRDNRLILIAKALQQFIHYDHVLISTSFKSDSNDSFFGFQRMNYADYATISGLKALKDEYFANKTENCFFKSREIAIIDGEAFSRSCTQNKINNKFSHVYGSKSCLWAPLNADNSQRMFLLFFSSTPKNFTSEQIELLTLIKPLLTNVLENISCKDKSASVSEFTTSTPNKATSIQSRFPGIIGKSPNLLFVMDQVTQAAPFDTTVLIQGETGTGKEGMVDAIHRLSGRGSKPLIKIHCAAIPQGLIESELFGHEKGAFTGALERRIGKFEQAHGGTIFLDEIGEVPLDIQSKLLRVLQEKEIERVGGRGTIKIDVRIIAATNRNLHKEVAAGNFRMDLYYRINVFPIDVPPLRERQGDIPLLINHFLQQNSNSYLQEPKTLSPLALGKMVKHQWPGNIRELQHVIERLVLINKGPVIADVDLQETELAIMDVAEEKVSYDTIREMERKHILNVINSCNGKINGKGGAAEILDLPPTTLNLRMKKLGIVWKHIFK